MKTRRPPARQPARSAADVAMSKTNPAEPEEATGQSPRRVISGPPRFDQQPGAIGSVCKHCGRSIREHIEGFCDPQDATQHFAQQELEATQREEDAELEEFSRKRLIEITKEQSEAPTGRIEEVGDFTPTDTDRIEIVEQALDLLQLLPECPERDRLARQCAVMVSMKMATVGYVVTEEEQQ